MWDVLPYLICTEGCLENEGILLANLLQSSRSTFSRGSFLSFLAFKEGMLGTPISVLGGWPTVSGRYLYNALCGHHRHAHRLSNPCIWGSQKHLCTTPSSIHNLSLSGADNPSSRYQPSRFCP